MKQTILEEKIDTLIRPVVKDMGYDIVQISFDNNILEILSENPEDGRIGLDECADVSRAISKKLEENEIIDGAYRLEVSSPGIDRPLTRLEDFQKYRGFDTKIELNAPNEDGQKRFRGIVEGLEGHHIIFKTEDGTMKIEFASLSKAKLVMNEELMDASREGVIPRKD
jgi:ribosome maturation factor RimP